MRAIHYSKSHGEAFELYISHDFPSLHAIH